MKDRDFPFLPLLLLGAMVYGAYWLYKNIELVEEEFTVNESIEAIQNPHLAASRLLGTEGFKPSLALDRGMFRSLDIASVGVLWLYSLDVLLDDREVARVRRWVESGGILLASPAGLISDSIPTAHGVFLEAIGIIALVENDASASSSSNSENENDNAAFLQLPDSTLAEKSLSLPTAYNPYFQLDLSKAEGDVSNIVNYPHLIVNKVGNGQVAIYSDENLFTNDEIGYFDEAYVLLWLTEPAMSKNVYVVNTLEEHPGLLKTLWRNFPLPICLLGVALVTFLRWASTRLGPVEQEMLPRTNNLMAHLQARGAFWYRHKHTSTILQDIQHATLEKLSPAASNSGTVSNHTDAVKQAADALQCSEKDAEKILKGKPLSDRNLLHTAQQLQKLNYRKQPKPN